VHGARDLSVVIPATDGRWTLQRTLASVEAALGPRDEVLVIRDGAGPAAARNAGARLASGQTLVFVDSDVELQPDALARVRAAFAEDPGLEAIFGSYDDRPAARQTVSQFRNLLHHHVHQRSAGEATTFWAGLGAVRRDAFFAVGGFDEGRYRAPMMEDIEFGRRLSASGRRIVLDPALRATHLKRWTLATMLRVDLTHRAIPWVRLLINRRELPAELNLGWRHRLTALLYAGATTVLGTRRRRLAAPLAAVAMVLNRDLHALLLRRGGLKLGLAGLLLHPVHHLVAVVAVPSGIVGHALEAMRGPRGPAEAQGIGQAEPRSRADDPVRVAS